MLFLWSVVEGDLVQRGSGLTSGDHVKVKRRKDEEDGLWREWRVREAATMSRIETLRTPRPGSWEGGGGGYYQLVDAVVVPRLARL